MVEEQERTIDIACLPVPEPSWLSRVDAAAQRPPPNSRAIGCLLLHPPLSQPIIACFWSCTRSRREGGGAQGWRRVETARDCLSHPFLVNAVCVSYSVGAFAYARRQAGRLRYHYINFPLSFFLGSPTWTAEGWAMMASRHGRSP